MAAVTKTCADTGCDSADVPPKSSKCRKHKAAYAKAYHEKNREAILVQKRERWAGAYSTDEYRKRRQASNFKSRMGITIQQRDEMLAAQGGVCAICKLDDPLGRGWCTDHDHACCPDKLKVCGKCIRGILCFRCNTLLGHARDNVETLQSAIVFLDEWEKRNGSEA